MAGVLCEKLCQDLLLKNGRKIEAKPITFFFRILEKDKLVKPDTLNAMQKIWEKRVRYLHSYNQEASFEDASIAVQQIGVVLKNEFQVTQINLVGHINIDQPDDTQ